MKHTKLLTTACRYCHYYKPEGRRGGVCQQLGAPVQSSWKACSLALPPFSPSWEGLEESWSLPDATRVLTSSLNKSSLTTLEETVASSSFEQAKAEAVLIQPYACLLD